ncbi:MAG TPA: peptidase C39 family protein [Anaerolineales bacterium]|nr:peptidase C39 family protein [Anaerolineales bacterium]
MNKLMLAFARIVLVGVIMLGMVSSASAKGKGDGAYQTGFVRWRAADGGFGGWTLDGVQRTNNTLQLDAATAKAGTDPYPAGGYNGGNYYNGGSFVVGEALSPVVSTTRFNFTEAIASWNASTPPGTWLEVQFTAQYGSRWSKWYVLGIWASDTSTVQRHSVQSQGDTDGYVAVDTFVSTNKKETANAFQLKIRLFSEDGIATPTVRNASLAYSTSAPKSASVSPGTPALWNHLLSVPQCSQMVYPDGGEVWCSPTSTAMVLGYWNTDPGSSCADREIPAVEGVYDWIYDGHGNWPFNTAYAATKSVGAQPLEGYVARFTSLAKAEEFINAGVPVIMSIAWNKGDLTGSSVASTNGHLLVLVGFDAQGNPIVNDPAFPNDGQVQATYLRSEFEPLWLQASGGTVYLIYPEGWSVPPLQ